MNSSAIMVKRNLKNKNVLLGICGGAAAYKSVEIVRRLRDEGASVNVIITVAAGHFVTPLSLEIASGNKVLTTLFESPMAHINLPLSADVMLIAPATANIISKIAHGIADDLLSTCLLSYKGPLIIAPSMNWRMYENRVFQQNLESVIAGGAIRIGPEKGELACGEEGVGRMSEVPEIVEAVKKAFVSKDLLNENIVVTGGPTREYIDPVRFISNRSSGKMGFALARAARDRGAVVTLISGPVALRPPDGLEFIQVETADEMLNAVKQKIKDATTLIMAAAVSDFTTMRKYRKKIVKKGNLTLQLQKTRDIISEVSGLNRRPFIIGFAAETGSNIRRAVEKMKMKKMDMVVFNDVTEPYSGFDFDTNKVVIIDRKGTKKLKLMSKDAVADAIMDRLVAARA